jgi:hypothetical protein
MNSVAPRIATLAHHAYSEETLPGWIGSKGITGSAMSNPFQFRVGDRVRARTPGFVPAGPLGTIQQVLLSVPGMYFVHFDGFAQPRLMHGRDLERVTEEPEARS